MLTKDIRQTIDSARDVLVGKIPNPQSQIEQITTAMIYKFMDDMDSESVEFGGERQYFVEELEKYAWSNLMSPQLGNEARMKLYTEALEQLPLSNRIPKLFRDIFKGAYLPFKDGQTLSLFLKEINELSYSNSENLGNGFEYLLSIMGSQGDAGQFRTPRHIIDFIVNVVQPKKTDTILDPACGTAGFLISAYKYILQDAKEHNQILTPAELTTLTENIQGYDISPDMVKLALVNMYLHKFKDPKIYEYDTLTNLNRWEEYFDCVLANPPFMTPKGGIQPHNKFGVKANRSEVLFVDYIMEHINSTGKAGIVVPEGIVFKGEGAYKELRKELVESNYLYAVVSLPSGVFNPYSGVKTSILFMDKQLAKKTDKILFVEVKQDGYDLGAQRRETPDKNDMPEALELIHKWQDSINAQTEFTTESKLVTIVEKSKLAEGGEYNLTASRYKETQDYSNCKWEMAKLNDICDVRDGTHDSPKYHETGYPLVTSKNLIGGKIDYTNVNYISKEDYEKICQRSNVDNGDVLYAMIGTIGNPVVVQKDRDFAIKNVALFKVGENNQKLNNKYLKYVLEHVTEDFNTQATGGTQKFVPLKFIRNYEIPLPPLEVQEEIVKELDGYQAVIDGAQKVVDNWKPTLPINPNWDKVKLKNVCKINPRTFDPVKEFGNTYCNYIDISSIENGTGVILQPNKINCNEAPSRARREVVLNDVLISTVRPNLQAFAILKTPYENAVASTGFAVLREIENISVGKFLLYSFFQNYILEQLIARMGKGAYPSVNQNDMENVDILLPSFEEQQEIVAKLETEEKIVEECKKLIKLHQDKIDNKIKSIWGTEQ